MINQESHSYNLTISFVFYEKLFAKILFSKINKNTNCKYCNAAKNQLENVGEQLSLLYIKDMSKLNDKKIT
jgi:hypothetical protein